MIKRFDIFLNESADDTFILEGMWKNFGSHHTYQRFLNKTFSHKIVSYEYFHPVTTENMRTTSLVEEVFSFHVDEETVLIYFVSGDRTRKINQKSKVVIIEKSEEIIDDPFGEEI